MVGPEITFDSGRKADNSIVDQIWQLEFAIAILVLLTSLAHALVFPIDLNMNCAVFLQAARSILSGGCPFIQFWDTNPPLIFFLSVPPVAVSQYFNVPVAISFVGSISMLALASFSIVFFIVRYNKTTTQHFLGSLVGFALSTCTVGYAFGERDQIFILMYLPLFVLRCIRWNGGRLNFALAIIVGLLASVGASLKPYFLLCALFPELVWVVQKRTLRHFFVPESIGVILGAVISAYSLLGLPIEARNNYFQVVAPLMMKGYSCMNCPFYTVITCENCRLLGFTAICATIFALILRKRSYVLIPLVAFMLAGFSSFVLQQKGWAYQQIPFSNAACMLVGLEVVILARLAYIGSWADQTGGCNLVLWCSNFWSFLRNTLITCLALVLGALMYVSIKAQHSWQSKPSFVVHDPVGSALVQFSKEKDYVAFLLPTLEAYPAITQLNRLPAFRYSDLFWVLLLERARLNKSMDDASVDRQEYDLVETLVADFKKTNPALVFIRDKNFYCPTSFSLVKMLERNHFRERCLSNYDLIENVDNFDILRRR